MLYVCSLVAEDACTEADLSELAGCIGVTAQLANDLRDGELALYGACDREELTRAVMLRLLAPALGGFALLARLGPRTHSRGARVAMAYMTITTTAFLCAAVGAPAPYRRPAAAGRGRAGRRLTRSLDHDAGAGAAFRRWGDPPAARCVAPPLCQGWPCCRVGRGRAPCPW